MQTKFSEDVIPLSDLKVNPGKIVNRVNDTHRPILLTSRGRGVAVVQGLDDYEKTAEELQFIKAVAKGLADIREIIHPPFRVAYLRNTSSVNLVRVWRSEGLLSLPDAET